MVGRSERVGATERSTEGRVDKRVESGENNGDEVVWVGGLAHVHYPPENAVPKLVVDAEGTFIGSAGLSCMRFEGWGWKQTCGMVLVWICWRGVSCTICVEACRNSAGDRPVGFQDGRSGGR
eukprot:1378661-Amorphochlora_amoeboformis.AAC.2